MTEEVQQLAIGELVQKEPAFQAVVDRFGSPPLWEREAGFPTLVRIILEQQVSLASARAAFERLLVSAGDLTPERFLQLDDDALKTIGFSRQKTRYSRALAKSVLDRTLVLETLVGLSDDEVRKELTAIKGIGTWTANIYLLMAMQRPDVWPRGDIALASAYQKLKGWAVRPDNETMEQIGEVWSPWRSVAARLLWHFYLSERGRSG